MSEPPHKIPSRWLLPAALLLACAAPCSAQNAPAPLRFAWPVPSKFVVDVTTRKDGRTVKVRQFVKIIPAPKTKDEYLLRFAKTEPLEINGVSLKTPKARAELRRELSKLRRVYPDLRISPQGELLGVRGLEEAVDRWLRIQREADPTIDDAVLATARKQTLAPANRRMLEGKVSQFWQVWVGAWRGQALRAGDQVMGGTTIPIGEQQVEASTVLHHQGESEGDVHLALQIELQGEEARKAFQTFLGGLAEGRKKPRVEAFRRSTRLEVLTNPVTLQPRLAAVEQVVTLELRGEKQAVKRESWEYTFRWVKPRPNDGERAQPDRRARR